MNEFSQIIKQLEAQLKEAVPELEILSPWESSVRRNPQAKAAVIAVSKVDILPASLGEFCSGSFSRCRKGQISLKMSLCSDSASSCWALWERCMHKMIFSTEVSLSRAECGEAVWKKEWGGVVLPVKLCCEFLIGIDQQPESVPDKIQIIRKGEKL